jgi:hypothetical protein
MAQINALNSRAIAVITVCLVLPLAIRPAGCNRNIGRFFVDIWQSDINRLPKKCGYHRKLVSFP